MLIIRHVQSPKITINFLAGLKGEKNYSGWKCRLKTDPIDISNRTKKMEPRMRLQNFIVLN